MNTSIIIRKLKKHIATKGYYENLGQKELSAYREYVFAKFSYSEAVKLTDSFTKQIEAL